MWSRIKRLASDWGSHLTFGDYVIRLGSAALSLGGGWAMSWAASATAWLQAWGPIASVFAGLMGFSFVALSLSGVYALIGSGRKRRAEPAYHQMLGTKTHFINPLSPRFMGERISLADLQIHPLSLDFPQQGKLFSDCIVVGPGTIALAECTLGDAIRFPGCNIARYNRIGYVMPNVFFRNCTFVNCTFLHITPFVRDEDEESFKTRFPGIKFTEEFEGQEPVTPGADESEKATRSPIS
jgi:hypothetical protein